MLRTRGAGAGFGVRAAAWLLASQGLFGSSSAFAYCRTTTCGSEKSADCAEPSKCPNGGTGIYWAEATVSIGVENGSGSRGIPIETARSVLAASMGAWTSVDCGGRPPSIAVGPIELVSGIGAGSGFRRDATSDSQNALRFFDDIWPHDTSAIALTTVRYGLESGKIVSADIEANAVDHRLTLVDAGGDFDLQSVLTHEAGHFFGLAHVIERPATMFAMYAGGGNIDRRTLEDDDRQGICAVYPSNRFDNDSGCSCIVGRRRQAAHESAGGAPRDWGTWLGLVAALALRRRTRARSQPSATPSA